MVVMYLNVIEESSWSRNKNVYTFSYSEKNNNINKITLFLEKIESKQPELHATGKMGAQAWPLFCNSCPIFMQGLRHCK